MDWDLDTELLEHVVCVDGVLEVAEAVGNLKSHYSKWYWEMEVSEDNGTITVVWTGASDERL